MEMSKEYIYVLQVISLKKLFDNKLYLDIFVLRLFLWFSA